MSGGVKLNGRSTDRLLNVCGAALGMAAGLSAIYVSTNGVFGPAIRHDFHWGRAQASQSYAASMLGSALISPIVGILMDRFGVKKVVLISAIVFAAAVACLSLQDASEPRWLALSLLIGMSGVGTSALGYLSILPKCFDRRLGLATGLAMIGLGAGTIVMPVLSVKMIATLGWRAAYQVLAGIALTGALVATLMLRESETPQSKHIPAVSHAPAANNILRQRAGKIFLMFLCVFLASCAVLSLVPHLPALLTDRGLSVSDAAKGASLIGLGVLLGRLSCGVAVDHIHAPFVACIYFGLGAAGFVLLGRLSSYEGALLASMLVGLAIGAEGDLLSYMVRAYLGVDRFGLLYGLVFAGYPLGAVIGPVMTGRYFDTHQSYVLPLWIAPTLLIVSSLLLLSLGRYERPDVHQGDLAD